MIDIAYLTALIKASPAIWVMAGGALVCLLIDCIFPKNGGKAVFVAGLLASFLAMVAAFHQWMSGGEFQHDLIVSDRLTLFFCFIVVFVTVISLLNMYQYLSSRPKQFSECVTLVLFSAVGMIFLFASDHLIVNFIGLETLSLAIYVLVGSNRQDLRSQEAALKYFIMGAVASAFFLYGVALLYGSFGTLRLGQLSQFTPFEGLQYLPRIAVTLIMAGLFFKLALAPFHFWVPDVYEGAPAPVTGFMATGVKVSALALVIRLITSLNYLPDGRVPELMTIAVILTLIVGNLGAIMQDDVKRMLAYSSIAHAGFLMLGLLVGYKEGKFDPHVSAAVMYYLIGYSVTTLGAFAVLSLLIDHKREATSFKDLHGLGTSRPVVALVFSLFLISLLGIPPTVGFTAKYGIISFAIQNGYFKLAIFAMIMTLVSAYYYLRPIVSMYFEGSPEKQRPYIQSPIHATLMFSLVFCALTVLYLGIKPEDYLSLASLAVEALK